ncbi:MAG: hypothetical protein IPL27_27105 [Lewinellaceae bacterium]|nr:hypothetical protein [Lewinellaceae bacterium]
MNARFNKNGVAAEDQSWSLTPPMAGKLLPEERSRYRPMQYSLNLRRRNKCRAAIRRGGGGAFLIAVVPRAYT